MYSPPTILVVDADPEAGPQLQRALGREGFRTELAPSGPLGFASALRRPPAVLVTDLPLPGFSGVELCRRLRATPATAKVPVVFLTDRADEVDRVVAFEVGADDYVTRPYSTRELCLRLRALLRRSEPASQEEDRIRLDHITVDRAQHRAWADGGELSLTAVEFRLLVALVRRGGALVTRAQLLAEVWGLPDGADTRTLDTHLRRLRLKLGPHGDRLLTVRGVGYRLAPLEPTTLAAAGGVSRA